MWGLRFRGLGFRGLGFRGLGVKGFRGLEFRGLGVGVWVPFLRSSLGGDGLAHPNKILDLRPSDLPDWPLTVCAPQSCVCICMDIYISDPYVGPSIVLYVGVAPRREHPRAS